MQNANHKKRVKELIVFRIGAMGPLIQHWIDRNPSDTLSKLVRRALRNELKTFAGKRFKHLYKEVS